MLFPRFSLEDWFAAHKASCVLNFGSTDVEPLVLSELVGEAEFAELLSSSLEYGGARGLATLRERVAATYRGVTADQVYCFAGATEAIFCVLTALIDRGDHVVVVTPTYQLLEDLPTVFGAELTRVGLTQAPTGWELSTQAVADALRPDTRALIIASPNNPTGWTIEARQLAELNDLRAGRGTWLVLDEIYRGLERPQPRLDATANPDRSIVIGGVSKTFGAAGLRVGWAVNSDLAVSDRLRTARYWTTLSSGVTERLAVRALEVRELLHRRSRQIVETNLRLLDEFAVNTDALSYAAPQGGTSVFAQLAQRSADDVALKLIREHGVFAVPSSALPYEGQFLRIGLGRVGFASCLRALQAVLGS